MPADALSRGVRRLGAGTIGAVVRIGYATRFLGAVITHSPQAIMRVGLTTREIYFSGVLSLVIIMVSGLFVGMVLALQGFDVLEKYGAGGGGGLDVMTVGSGIVLITPFDITSGLLGVEMWDIHGYAPAYSRGLVKNLVLWTLRGRPMAPK